jgi:hypothetical protein
VVESGGVAVIQPEASDGQEETIEIGLFDGV